ncbi:MAG TPA: Vms1/Ankzf1 family peptidyl-tRNA hydrolase [Solirubrobacteraceae bacterium]|nr:Vms1/Ankzf1 family peptidyl-tRNA hydrolase [Solirubrobacteraceae bacterium]
MTSTAQTARRILEQTLAHPVVSVFFDLDPEQFATAPARASQLRSLLDEADRTSRSDESLAHEDRKAVTEALRRVESYLQSDEAPVSGARALAVFCSGGDDLFEAVQLPRPTAPRVVIARTPFVEPLVAGDAGDRWCVTLVSRDHGRIFEGEAPHLRGTGRVQDDVHGQHSQGGWSQANYERSAENEAEQHFRHLAQELYHHWQRQPFSRLVLGGPEADVARFAELLHNDLRPALATTRLSLDAETASPSDVQAAAATLVESEREGAQAAAVAELAERAAANRSAVLGLENTLTALGERRVETLVLARNFNADGARCDTCGLLYPAGAATCPADGTELAAVPDLREAAIEAAVLQDAEVVVAGEGSETPPSVLVRGGGIGALLRF